MVQNPQSKQASKTYDKHKKNHEWIKTDFTRRIIYSHKTYISLLSPKAINNACNDDACQKSGDRDKEITRKSLAAGESGDLRENLQNNHTTLCEDLRELVRVWDSFCSLRRGLFLDGGV